MGASTLRRAAGLLVPASLRMRVDGPRHLTFVTDVAESDQVVLTLDPVSDVTPESRAFLDFKLDGQNLWVAGRLTDLDGRRARLVVRGVPSTRPPRLGRLSADGTVAVFVPADSGVGRCFCPVLDLGRQVMRIDSSLPFPRGTI